MDGIRAVEITSALASPVQLTAPAGDGRLFVVDQVGRIVIIEDGTMLPTPVVDMVATRSRRAQDGQSAIARLNGQLP